MPPGYVLKELRDTIIILFYSSWEQQNCENQLKNRKIGSLAWVAQTTDTTESEKEKEMG